MASDEEKTHRLRLFWVDWLRTQSVWNVVCGHVWWTVRDAIKLKQNIYQAPWNESARMLEYVVDQGSFHTIPIFFLVSGYLTSLSFNIDFHSLRRFAVNRLLRVVPPFAFGLIMLYIVRVSRGEPVTASNLLLSYLWFLWALALIQIFTIPYFVMVRMLVRGEVCGRTLSACAALHAAICIAMSVAFQMQFDLSGNNKGAWLAGLPLSSCTSLVLFWAPGLKSVSPLRDLAHVGGTLVMGVSTFIFAGAHAMCPVSAPDCDNYDWLSINLVQGVLLVILMYLTGFCAGEVLPQANRVLRGTPADALCVSALLLSCFWPYFTYWGPEFIRRNAFLKTYQTTPTFNMLLGAGEAADSAMQGGRGPSWAIARMWFWGAAMLVFAKCLCDKEIHPFIHRHVTQSGMVIYICHYLFIPSVVDAFYKSGLITDPTSLTYATIATVFVLCGLVYSLIVSNPYTAKAFGIIPADLSRKVVLRAPATGSISAEHVHRRSDL